MIEMRWGWGNLLVKQYTAGFRLQTQVHVSTLSTTKPKNIIFMVDSQFSLAGESDITMYLKH